nr:MAG TPA: hypothetical protein [Caudoviricetes sp.]DAG16731.1 MAG TPA: hypothetical protein [Caudoviricetes sp.]
MVPAGYRRQSYSFLIPKAKVRHFLAFIIRVIL